MVKIQIGCIVFRRKGKDYEFLLLKRISNKGGFWQYPCGGLEGAESQLDAVYRELLEETGIKKEEIIGSIKEVHYFKINMHYLTGKQIETIDEYVFGVEVNPTVRVQIDSNPCPEHEEFRWVSFEEALKLLKWENNKKAVQKLNCILSRN